MAERLAALRARIKSKQDVSDAKVQQRILVQRREDDEREAEARKSLAARRAEAQRQKEEAQQRNQAMKEKLQQQTNKRAAEQDAAVERGNVLKRMKPQTEAEEDSDAEFDKAALQAAQDFRAKLKQAAEDEKNQCPVCRCGLEGARRTTQKEGPNQNRAFFCCPKEREQQCRSWIWEDEFEDAMRAQVQKSADAKEPLPKCSCGGPAKVAVSKKDGPNKDRVFYTCAANFCNFFQWADSAADRQCSCGKAAALRTVKKEGPNQGRSFWSCTQQPQCNFFEWADEASKGGAPAQAAGAPAPAPAVSSVAATPTPQRSALNNSERRPQAGTDAEEPQKCDCGAPATSFEVRKPGPNLGRKFWKCSQRQCNFFKWDGA